MPARGALGPALVVAALVCACSTKLVPKPFEIPESSIAPIEASGPLAVRVALTGNPEHEVTVPMVEVTVSDDAFSEAVAARLIEELLARGVPVDPTSERSLEVGVDRVSLQQATMGSVFCTLECGVRLGDAEPFWLQAKRGSLGYEKACAAAASQAVIEILNEPTCSWCTRTIGNGTSRCT